MSRETYACPRCQSLLRRTPQSPPGSSVRCARCATVFAVPPEEVPQIATAPLLHEEVVDRRSRRNRLPRRGPRPVRLDNNYRFDMGRCFSQAWAVWGDYLWPYTGFTGACGSVLGLFWVAAVFSVALTFGLSLIVLVPLAALVAQITAALPLGVAVRAVRREEYEVMDFIQGLERIVPLILYTLLNGLFVLLAYGPIIVYLVYAHWGWKPATWVEVALAASYSLLVVPVVYLFLQTRFTFALCLVFDQNMGMFQALATSWKMTRGHFWALFGFQLLQHLMFLAALIPCGLGTPLAAPLIILLRGAAYVNATEVSDEQLGLMPLPARDEDDY